MFISIDEKKYLLKLARNTIERELNISKEVVLKKETENINKKVGAFVTLHLKGNLRGCIGYIVGVKPLYETIIDMAKSAAFRDPRFNSVTPDEISDIDIEISVLSEMIEVNDINDIKIGRDGLLIKRDYHSGLLLPQVATEWNWDTETFLKETCRKAGLPSNSWKESNVKIFRFSAEIFREKEI